MVGGLMPYPECRPSRLKWVGEIPSHWGENRAKYYFLEVDERSATGDEELLSVSHVTGVTPRTQKNVTMFKAESYIGHKVCQPGDLVINTMWAWMAAMGIAKQAGITSPSYGVYRPLRLSDYVPEYVDHLLRTKAYASEYFCRSTGIRSSRLRLYPDDFLDIPIVCPPRDEQRAMLTYLKTKILEIHRFVRNKERLIELLQEQKQAIINRAVTRGIDPDVRLKPSGIDWLGDVPEHWEVKRLKFMTKITYGISPNESTYNSDSIGTILINGPDEYSIEDFGKTRAIKWTTAPTKFAPKGALLFCLRGSTTGRLNVCQDNVSIGRGVAALVAMGDGKFIEYVMMALRYGVSATFRGSTFPSVTRNQLNNYWAPKPPPGEQTEIAAYIGQEVAHVDKAVNHVRRQIDLVREYRTRLIADVVTGKVDVRGIPVEDVPAGEALEEFTESAEMEEALGTMEAPDVE